MNKAVWIIAHGSSKSDWVELIDRVIQQVKTDLPLVISFLENVEGRLIKDGINQLETLGANKVFVIPLFVSSGSTHIAEIRDILSLYEKKFDFYYTDAMDDHPLVIEHIVEQADLISTNPRGEDLLLIGHGSDKEEFHTIWTNILDRMVERVKESTNYADVQYATFLPNTIATKIEQSTKHNGSVLIIPLFLSSGVFTKKKISKVIEGYDVKYNQNTYLDSDWVAKWLTDKINSSQKGIKEI